MPMASYYDFVNNKYESGMNNLKIAHSWVFKKEQVNFKNFIFFFIDQKNAMTQKDKNIQTLLLLLVLLINARKSL
jgi:hypothetical protein